MGSFYVSLGPPQALTTGAGWRVLELTNQNYYSDTATYSLPMGTNQYHVAFRAIPGFVAPASRTLPLIAGRTAGVLAYYVYTNLSPQTISASVGAGGVFKMTCLGYAGLNYAIQESTNLVNWVPLITNQVPQDGLLRFLTTNPPAKSRAFYRARLVQ